MKISCLTITQLNRIKLLERSIHSYAIQTIAKKSRELIIVHHEGKEGNNAIQKLSTKYNVEAKIFSVSKCPLGELRNISLEVATGDILCQWDDDDFYHPNRLRIQSNPFTLNECAATTLDSQLFWFSKHQTIYIRRAGKEGIHGSIMFRKNLGMRYRPELSKGEDTQLIKQLLSLGNHSIYRINNHPELYVRTYHGLNTWDFEQHFSQIQQAFDMEWLLMREEKIRKWLKILQFSNVKVCDKNHNVAFYYEMEKFKEPK
jgi:glycosyltransferase involved in cell wall biosynthesis